MSAVSVHRYHDISCGHRVVGHEGKCRFLHGHNYRIHFFCASDTASLDAIGRVIDFGVIKSALCEWLEDRWDHRMLLWDQDPQEHIFEHMEGIVFVPFNPTAENLGLHLLNVVGPHQLAGTGVRLFKVVIDETRKCSATVEG